MSKVLFVIGVLLCLSQAGCISELLDPAPPPIVAPGGHPISDSAGRRMEGVYVLQSGNDLFGDTLVALWRAHELCIYSGDQVIFSENLCSSEGYSIRFNGYYRFVRSDVCGCLTLSIRPTEGGDYVMVGSGTPSITFRGSYEEPSEHENRTIVLKRVRDIDRNSFLILGNCGGGRNSERLGISENSIEMIRFADKLGCNGIEVDLHVTEDDSLILFHDDDFSPRSVLTTYIIGKVSNYPLRQIRRNATLLHGEQIPTLQECLDFIVDSTNLTFVWLDPKVTRDMDLALKAQLGAQRRANEIVKRGRAPLHIVYGLPGEDYYNTYNSSAYRDSVDVLIEYSPDLALSTERCRAWGPRWTLGCDAGMVARLQAAGKLVIPWTLDSPEYMSQFLSSAPYDGILSNYPSMLTGQYYQKGVRH